MSLFYSAIYFFVVLGGLLQKPPCKNLGLRRMSPSDVLQAKDSHDQTPQLSEDYSFYSLDHNAKNRVQSGIEAKERVT